MGNFLYKSYSAFFKNKLSHKDKDSHAYALKLEINHFWLKKKILQNYEYYTSYKIGNLKY